VSVTVGGARALCRELLEGVGLQRAHADTTARCIVLADSWGVGSHGLMRLPYYLERTLAGGYPAEATLTTVTDTGPVVVLDGGGGLGHWQLWAGAELASERAGQYGIGAASVGNSGHCGALGVYTLPALDRGLLALVFSNGPAVMAPWGASTPMFSTSPLAAGIPCRPRPSIVDMATSAVARGKIASYAQRGEPLPPGWALDDAGEPTQDAQAALKGLLAPLGGAKGFALAFMVEALAGGLVGPSLSADVSDMFAAQEASTPQRIGHLVLVLDPARFDVEGGEGASRRLADLAARVEGAGGRLPGSGRRLPEDIADDAVLDLPPALQADLRSWAERLQVRADVLR
jgi:(2R)-3-sulfolactate dehydrogenase (NADP+)